MQGPIVLAAFPAPPSRLGRSGNLSLPALLSVRLNLPLVLVGTIDLTTNLHNSFIHWSAFAFTLLSIVWDIFSAIFLICTTSALASAAADGEDGNGGRKCRRQLLAY